MVLEQEMQEGMPGWGVDELGRCVRVGGEAGGRQIVLRVVEEAVSGS